MDRDANLSEAKEWPEPLLPKEQVDFLFKH